MQRFIEARTFYSPVASWPCVSLLAIAKSAIPEFEFIDAEVDLNSTMARELVAALLAHKVMVDPTLDVFGNMLLRRIYPGVVENSENDFVPESPREFWPTYSTPEKPETRADREKEFKKYEELTGLLFRSGVPLLAETDEPEPSDPPGFSLHEELELLVESGLPPAAALQAATINPARIVKQEKELGSIAEGKWADLYSRCEPP